MANNLYTNPIYIDTDMAVAAGNTGTNWRGTGNSPVAAKSVGGIGIRPEKIIVTPLGATTAGAITISEVNSAGTGTTNTVFRAQVATVAATSSSSVEYDLVGTSAGWHDFIATGLTATGCAILIYYRP